MGEEDLQEEFIQMLEYGEAEGWADRFASAPKVWGSKVMRVGGAYVYIMPRYDGMVANKVIGLGLTEQATEQVIEVILSLYQDVGIENFASQICPLTQSPTIAGWLAEHGIKPVFHWVKMYRRADQDVTAATDLRIERIGRERQSDYSRIFCQVFGMPADLRPWMAAEVGRDGWCHYLGFDGEMAVATGALFVNGQVGALLGATTLESHRGQGAQSALLAKRITDARAMGCEWLVSETWEEQSHHNPSYRNLLRAGFHEAYSRPNLMSRE